MFFFGYECVIRRFSARETRAPDLLENPW